MRIHCSHYAFVPPVRGITFKLFHSQSANLYLVLWYKVFDPSKLVLCIFLVLFNFLIFRAIFIFEGFYECVELICFRW